ncbi:MAG: GH92 family glycosyl hydrolase [Rhodanobacteraceae bacterium]
MVVLIDASQIDGATKQAENHFNIGYLRAARMTGRRFDVNRSALVAAVACASILIGACATPASAATDFAALVDPFIGTGNGGKVTGDIDTFPGAVMPFGMLSWSPYTVPNRTDGGGYFYADTHIGGFSLTHVSGPGCPAGGEVPILPTTGAVGSPPDGAAATFSHAQEHATPGEYQVVLDPGGAQEVDVKLAAADRTGIGRFTFPATPDANFLFKVSDGQTTSETSNVRIVGNDEVAGSETSGHFCRTASTETLYFVVKFNRPFQRYGTWGAGTPNPGIRAVTGSQTGAWVTFDTRRARTVDAKVAISYVSIDDALANLEAEEHGWDFNAVAARAHDAWNQLLSRIDARGGTHDQRVQFYTGLYHALLHPNLFSDDNGQYIGFDDKVHTLPKGQAVQYANFSGWDIYRSEVPLLALLVPNRVGDMVSSLLNDQAQGGWLPKWGYDNDYTGVMNGDAADPIIAEAYAFGARNFDTHAALVAMVNGATKMRKTPDSSLWSGKYIERPNLHLYEHLGYVPQETSETLEYATADFSIAALAKALGDAPTYQKFLQRSGDWSKVFDPRAAFRGYKGYMQSRLLDGQFQAGPAFDIHEGVYGQTGFEEGNAIQYTWMVPQDFAGLIHAMGGDAKAVARLDLLFTHLNVGPNEAYYWAGNEMSLGTPWVYDYAGAPWKTQAVVRRILQQGYAATPGGEPGNDDLGAMSSWLVWADLGLYPETPGAPVLVTGAPVFPYVTLTLANEHRVVIRARGAPADGYIRALTVDGKPWTKDWLPVDVLLGSDAGSATTDLDYQMATRPDRQWGTAKGDRPPSWGAVRWRSGLMVNATFDAGRKRSASAGCGAHVRRTSFHRPSTHCGHSTIR